MRPLLGTFVEIEATGDPSRLPGAIAAAFLAIERVHRLMSWHEPGSDVSRINAAEPGEPVAVEEATWAVLAAAQMLGDLSEGAFDVATAPALVRHGLLPRLVRHGVLPGATSLSKCSPVAPAPSSIAATASGATYRDLELLPGSRVRWRRNGKAWVDLGGIAKGYAVDRAVETLRAHGIEQGTVNAGGDLRCFGDPRPLYLRAPDDPGRVWCAGEICNSAAATSADSFRPGALVDPRLGTCVPWGGSITVVAPDCLSADALTKVVRLAPRLAPRVLAQFGAHVVTRDSRSSRPGWQAAPPRDIEAPRDGAPANVPTHPEASA